MNIDDDHLYHGAALIQIAEHPSFTAINALKLKSSAVRNAYKINEHIAVFLKYCSKPNKSFGEYVFTFHEEHLDTLRRIDRGTERTVIALVCVQDREICCLTYGELMALIERRRADAGGEEEQYVILVTAPKGKSLRVYINAPGRKKTMLGKPFIVSRKAFPSVIFEAS